MIEIDVSTDPSAEALARFGDALRRYTAESRKRADEIIRAKGRDVGIRLYKGFEAEKWGGPGRHPGLARAEQLERRAVGLGTRVRPSLQGIYDQARSDLDFDVRSAGQRGRYAADRAEAKAARKAGRQARSRRRALWQKIVKTELGLRQSSIGFQAAAFLMFRRRGGQLVSEAIANRRGETIGSVKVADGAMEIESRAGHSAETAQKYGIVDRALNESAADMLTYVHRKELEALMGVSLKGARA